MDTRHCAMTRESNTKCKRQGCFAKNRITLGSSQSADTAVLVEATMMGADAVQHVAVAAVYLGLVYLRV